jgi:cellulose synthase/poly-beta-1,6-N-acetylglucosamine synthase-like glycosyltransferase
MSVWWLSVAAMALVWLLYPLALWVLSRFRKRQLHSSNHGQPRVCVLIAAHNEAANLEKRITNIYASEYPAALIEVVVASDGSTDSTVQVIDGLRQQYPRLKFVDISPQVGRSNAHNAAVRHSDGTVLVFTDAETVFDQGFLVRIVGCFQDETVGFTSGVLKYRNQSSTAVTESAGLYWKFEYFLRELESQLGLYAFGSGACCAVRKELYRDIPPVGDVDFTTPLDVVLQGMKCVHVSNAIAYDEMPDSQEREFRARVRMTAKNLYGTIQRWGFAGVWSHPIYTLVILFHKIGRWLTPYWMLALLIANVGLLAEGGFYVAAFVAQIAFYLIALAGYRGIDIPLARTSYSFCLANAGFFVGVLKAVTGRVPKLYKPVSQTQR